MKLTKLFSSLNPFSSTRKRKKRTKYLRTKYHKKKTQTKRNYQKKLRGG